MSPSPFPLTVRAVADVVGGLLASGEPDKRLPRVSIDSRTIGAGDLFLAIVGPHFDGHAFTGAALERGAAGLLVSDPTRAVAPADVPVIVVSDTLAALQALARHVRRLSGAKVVAITGSAGKTSTKEATAAVLESRFRTLRNRGNLNNHIGLPVSLLELQAGAEVAVMELGMNHAGEISLLVDIAEPDVRVWTNVGTAHLEYFGTQDAIADAKAEILERATGTTVLVSNADDPRVAARTTGFPGRAITFGIDRDAVVRATDVEDLGLSGMSARVTTPEGAFTLRTPLLGRGHLMNLLAAAAVALAFEIATAQIAERLAGVGPAARRGEVVRLAHDVVVVDDSYNASPSALERTLEAVAAERGRRRVAFLGEMLELGEGGTPLHEQAGRDAVAAGIEVLVTVGGGAARAMHDAAVRSGLAPSRAWHRDTSADAAELVREVVRPGDVVLVKGSRGIAMERVVQRLAAEFA